MKRLDGSVESTVNIIKNNSLLVGLGILLSRIAGLIRERVFAYYLGNSDAADVFKAALRIPNFLQNLLGEGTLSASFIPAYSKLLGDEKTNAANSLAKLVGALLGLIVAVIVLIGLVCANILVDLIAPGFDGEKRLEAIKLVQIFFPATGVLVLSAWCLGVLNSHRKFFLSYAAPVIWNVAIIIGLYLGGSSSEGYRLAEWAAYGVVAGSILQTLIQLPLVAKLIFSAKAPLIEGVKNLKTVVANFVPAVLGRGVVQISAFIDSIIASFLPVGAIATLAYAQTIYLLPVSLFGMSISAAELPELSRTGAGSDAAKATLLKQLQKARARLHFFIIPCVGVLLVFGDLIAAALYQTGQFTSRDAAYVGLVLAGFAPGLLAATSGRLYASALFAIHQTGIVTRIAILRVSLSAGLGYYLAIHCPELIAADVNLGLVGLTFASALGSVVECVLLRKKVLQLIGVVPVNQGEFVNRVLFAGIGLVVGFLLTDSDSTLHPILNASMILGVFGIIYLSLNRFFSRKPL